jgi:alkaline phosphatase
VKWRNQLLALFCLFVFAGLGVLYFQHWVVQKPFAIIIFIGEGLTPRQLAAARLYVGGADARLSLDSMPHLALLMNPSKDFAVSDQPAAATALATGVKVNNGSLGKDAEGKDISTIVELARHAGRATGLVTDRSLAHTVPAAFYAHNRDAIDRQTIATQFAEGQKFDVALGGGAADLTPVAKGGHHQDNRDLVLDLRANGFEVVRTRSELETIPAWRGPKVVGLFAEDDLAYEGQIEQRKDQPALGDMVRRGIELLQYNRRGYLLVVDAGLMRRAALENSGENALRQLGELDHAVSIARRYAGARSSIIICGDVAAGGMSLNGHPFRRDSGIALLGLNSSGEPWITWATGPKGTRSYGVVKVGEQKKPPAAPPALSEETEPAAFYLNTPADTAEDVVGFGTGPGTEALSGTLDSTIVFSLMRDAL